MTACTVLATIALASVLWTDASVMGGVFGLAAAAVEEPKLTAGDLNRLLDEIRDDDNRMVRWDATKHTRKVQKQVKPSGSSFDDAASDGSASAAFVGCEPMVDALRLLMNPNTSTDVAATAMEYATFCITDNPIQRARLVTVDENIYKRIVQHVTSTESPKTSAMASHLIYIASFANKDNHQGFFRAGAVAALGQVVKDYAASMKRDDKANSKVDDKKADRPRADQAMWAAAALQNLAASYCDTKGDGRCYWGWGFQDSPTVQIEEEHLPVVSDGTSVRKTTIMDTGVMDALIELACQGPVRHKSDPHPGQGAVVGEHDDSPTIVPWAATGALKNLALEPEGKAYIDKSPKATRCLCRMFHSPDWLEQNKGQGVIHHLRADDPCWMDNDGLLCVDYKFIDEDSYHCGEYGDASEQECDNNFATHDEKLNARAACCACGGGDRDPAQKAGVSEPEL